MDYLGNSGWHSGRGSGLGIFFQLLRCWQPRSPLRSAISSRMMSTSNANSVSVSLPQPVPTGVVSSEGTDRVSARVRVARWQPP